MENKKKLLILVPVIAIAAALAYRLIQSTSHNNPPLIRVSGNIEVTDAEVSLATSRLAYIQALYADKVAQANLEKAMGMR